MFKISASYSLWKCLEIFTMLNQWNLKGPLNPPLGRNLGFSNFPLYLQGNSNQYTDFHASMIPGSAFDHISRGVRTPGSAPGLKLFFFFFGFVIINPINVEIFSFLGYLESLGISPKFCYCQGPWFRPWIEILGFRIFPLQF